MSANRGFSDATQLSDCDVGQVPVLTECYFNTPRLIGIRPPVPVRFELSKLGSCAVFNLGIADVDGIGCDTQV